MSMQTRWCRECVPWTYGPFPVPFGIGAFVGDMCGRPVLKMSLKARSREEADAEPFCGGSGYGRVRGSAITGLRSNVSTHAHHHRLRGMRERGWGMGTGPATETKWSGAALGTTCNTGRRGEQSGVLRGRGRGWSMGWWVVVVVDSAGLGAARMRGVVNQRTPASERLKRRVVVARAAPIADGHPIPRSVGSLASTTTNI
jgi:hypothetical protein